MIVILRLILAFLIVMAVPSQGLAQTLKKEPAMGALKEGQRVLVDDGTCPKGQIKEVIGGNHVKAGGTKQTERRRRCVARN